MYSGKGGGELWFRAIPLPLPRRSFFAKLKAFFGSSTPAKVGDEAYFDKEHALHIRKGKVRFYINLSSTNTAAQEKQITDLGNAVAGRV